MKKLLLISLLFINIAKANVDLIVFSYDRAMQLYALLESIESHMKGLDSIHIIYRVSNEQHELAYNEVANRFVNLNLKLMKQDSNNPKQCFKPMVLSALSDSNSEYVVFAVDDIIISNYIDLNECAQILKHMESNNKKIHGFYLRLGENITHSYPNLKVKVPPLKSINNEIMMWRFADGGGDWGYPNSVDLIVYKKLNVISEISHLTFNSPNTFEGNWARVADLNKYGICYKHSKMVNIPANKVQHDNNNLHMGSFSAQELLELFNQGFKIDISEYFGINNKSSHHNHVYKFIKR